MHWNGCLSWATAPALTVNMICVRRTQSSIYIPYGSSVKLGKEDMGKSNCNPCAHRVAISTPKIGQNPSCILYKSWISVSIVWHAQLHCAAGDIVSGRLGDCCFSLSHCSVHYMFEWWISTESCTPEFIWHLLCCRGRWAWCGSTAHPHLCHTHKTHTATILGTWCGWLPRGCTGPSKASWPRLGDLCARASYSNLGCGPTLCSSYRACFQRR